MFPQYNPQMYQPQMYQPQRMFEPQSLIRVTGMDGAKAYQLGANSTVALFDSNEDIMYIKSTDGAGFPTLRAFRFTEFVDTPPKQVDYISREEFENFKKEMMDYGKQFIQSNNTERNSSGKPKSNTND